MNDARTTREVDSARSQRGTSALVAGYIRELSQQDALTVEEATEPHGATSRRLRSDLAP
jgi:hypothetical protein